MGSPWDGNAEIKKIICALNFGELPRERLGYRDRGIPLEGLKRMPDPEVKDSFYPLFNVRGKSEDIILNYETICNRSDWEGSNVKL